MTAARRRRPRAPLAVSALLAFPLFLMSLMAFSLAIERPDVRHVPFKGRIVTVFHTASHTTEAKIWLLALVPAAVVVLAGLVGRFVPFGTVLPSLVSLAAVLVLASRLDRWEALHSGRFPDGVDLVKDTNSANNLTKGQWEAAAHETASSLGRWTIGLALAAILVVALREAHRRLRKAPEPAPPPPEIVTGSPEVAPSRRPT